MRDETDRGFRDFSGNELTVGSIVDDPAAVRVASPSGTNKISGNVLQPDGTQHEKTLLVLTQDESGGCYDFQAQLPGRTDDKGMIRLARLSPKGFELFVPVVHSTQPDPPPPPPDPNSPTHGIPEGDFARIIDVYGFACDEEQDYLEGRKTWTQIIERMDERDDYHHFPKIATVPVLTPEERLQRVLDVEAVRLEFPDQPLDENGVQSYLAGRKDLREFHDDEERRAGFCREPYHRPGRQY